MNYQELVMKGEFININGMLLNSEVLLLSSYLSRKGQLWGVVEDKDGMAKFLEGEESTLTSVHIATLPLTSEALFKQVKNVEKAKIYMLYRMDL